MQITSKQDFVDTFPRGALFHWIETLGDGTPYVIRSTRVVEIVRNGRYLSVRHAYTTPAREVRTLNSAVGDLISELRRVFTTRAEAEAAMIERKAAIKADPGLLDRLYQKAYNDAYGIKNQDHLACAAV